jgi:hypothetical protein
MEGILPRRARIARATMAKSGFRLKSTRNKTEKNVNRMRN